VNVVHELTPAQDLANKTLLAGQRDVQLQDITHHLGRQKAMEIQERRDSGVEEPLTVPRHGVFEGTKVLQALTPSPPPESSGIFAGGWQSGQIHLAGMMAQLA
jgi:hypothetical protein